MPFIVIVLKLGTYHERSELVIKPRLLVNSDIFGGVASHALNIGSVSYDGTLPPVIKDDNCASRPDISEVTSAAHHVLKSGDHNFLRNSHADQPAGTQTPGAPISISTIVVLLFS